MEDDWDLHAVVRGAASTSATTTTTASCSQDQDTSTHLNSSSFQSQEEDQFQFFSDPFEQRCSQSNEDLHDLFTPFFPKMQQIFPRNYTPISPLSVLGGLQDLSPPPLPPHQRQQQPPQQKQEKQKQNQYSVVAGTIGCPNSAGHTPTPKSKRSKGQVKKVFQVPAEGLPSDTWSWRKYGQKPIKGSPFPRGYYKCSTTKGCLARKQVERSRSDPEMLMVTYTGEHNHPMPTHRNSLAGIPRQKSVTPETATSNDPTRPSSSVSPVSVSPPSGNTESREDTLMEDEDDEVGVVSDHTAAGDDFFEGLEEFNGTATGDCFPGQFPATLTFPWGPTVAQPPPPPAVFPYTGLK